MLVRVSPFFFLLIGVAGYAKALGVEYLIANIFTGSPTHMVILAALFGALSPFCLCGVIPLVVGLLAAGVPLAPVMVFWIVSSLMVTDVYQ